MSSVANQTSNQAASTRMPHHTGHVSALKPAYRDASTDDVQEGDQAYPQMTTGEGLRVFVSLLPSVGLLLAFLLLRVYAIDGRLPYFVDELRHIERSRIVWSFSDLQVSTTPSKFLLYYWIGLFDLPAYLPGWMARTPVAMFSMIGAAGTFALAKLLFSRRVAFLAMVILLILPFMLFYERLALSDPLAASFVVVVAWWSLVYARRPTRQRAAVLGILLSLMLAAKILTGPLLMFPILAILVTNPIRFQSGRSLWSQIQQLFRAYWPTLVVAVVLIGVVWGITMGFYVMRRTVLEPDTTDPIVDRYLYEGIRRGLGQSESQNTVFYLWKGNILRLAEVLVDLWGPILVIMALLALPSLIRRFPREILYVGLPVVLLWVTVITVAGELSTRYLTLVGHLAVILVAVSVWALHDELRAYISRRGWSRLRPLIYAPIAAVVIWATMFGGNFYLTLASEPETLDMPTRDVYEYFENQTGYALRDALNDLAEMPPISEGVDVPIVYGMVRNCHFLPNHVAADTPIQIRCSRQYASWPRRDWPDSQERYTDVEALVDEYSQIYMMMEEFPIPMIDRWLLEAQLKFVKSYPRPGNGVPVNLYIVSPREPLNTGVYVMP